MRCLGLIRLMRGSSLSGVVCWDWNFAAGGEFLSASSTDVCLYLEMQRFGLDGAFAVSLFVALSDVHDTVHFVVAHVSESCRFPCFVA